MSNRIAPTLNESEDHFLIDTRFNYLTETKYVPVFIDHVMNYLSATGREKAASLYSWITTISFRIGRPDLHMPSSRIEKDLGWSEHTVIKYRKTLSDLGLIRKFRLDNNGIKSESRIYVVPHHLIDLQELYNTIYNEEYQCKLRKYVLHYLAKQLKKFTDRSNKWVRHLNNLSVEETNGKTRHCKNCSVVNNCETAGEVGNDKKVNNNKDIENGSRHCKNYSVKELLHNSISMYASGQKTPDAECFLKIENPSNPSSNNLEKNSSYSFILKDGSYFQPSRQKLEFYRQNFSQLDLESEFRDMRVWCDDNPTKRKTRKGALRFISGWLTRAVKNVPKPTQPKKYKPIEDYIPIPYHKKKARQLQDQIDVKPHQIKEFARNIAKMKILFDSIPKYVRSGGFYKSHYEIMEAYIEWLEEKCKFDSVSYKLINVNHDMFKKYIETEFAKVTAVYMSIKNSKYISRSSYT